jgi:tryptophan halogenase
MRGIRTLAIAGQGAIPWITAAALVRAFPKRAFEVTVIDSGVSRDARAGYCTLPSQRGMHGLLGLNEPQLVERTGATFRLAAEHRDWQGTGSHFLHAHGDIGLEFGATPFYKFLLSEANASRPQAPEAFSVAGAAARLGRFARPMGEARTLTSSFTYGFHFDAAAYTNALRTHALQLGVRAGDAPLASVARAESGAIEALVLTDGRRVAADLYVDATGPDAKLIGDLSSERESWSQWLPCDAMLSGRVPESRGEAPPVTQTFAVEQGWMWRMPLVEASMIGHVFSTRFTDVDSAAAEMRAREPALREAPLLARFDAGRRRRLWVRNCVAIGAAAIELEPLAGADFHLAQLGIATLIELFPHEGGDAIEAAEYDRLMADCADRIRDFTLAHYHAGAPRAGEFWDATRASALPPALAAKLDLFSASGRINVLDNESFEEIDWAWLLIGSGRKPATLEMQIRNQLSRLAPPEVAALRAHIGKVAASMPPHLEYVRRQGAAARPRPSP